MGTMGIAICWSGPVTVCRGMGMGMYDMVLVSKCSMARGGLAVVGDGVAVDGAHTRDTSAGSAVDCAVVGAIWALARGCGLWALGLGLEVEVERCGGRASGEDGETWCSLCSALVSGGQRQQYRKERSSRLTWLAQSAHQAITLQRSQALECEAVRRRCITCAAGQESIDSRGYLLWPKGPAVGWGLLGRFGGKDGVKEPVTGLLESSIAILQQCDMYMTPSDLRYTESCHVSLFGSASPRDKPNGDPHKPSLHWRLWLQLRRQTRSVAVKNNPSTISNPTSIMTQLRYNSTSGRRSSYPLYRSYESDGCPTRPRSLPLLSLPPIGVLVSPGTITE